MGAKIWKKNRQFSWLFGVEHRGSPTEYCCATGNDFVSQHSYIALHGALIGCFVNASRLLVPTGEGGGGVGVGGRKS